jgi:peptide/nickel transport system substrate-binding protein
MHGLDRRNGVVAVFTAATAVALVALALVQSGNATPRAAAASTCTQHGTVTFGVGGADIPALDPNTIASAAQWTIQPLLYNGLTKYAHDGSVLPDLATSWKHSADLKTWWFFLRHGVKYANGRPFTAKDVVANVLRVLNPATASQARGNIKDVRSVRAIGDYEVRFKTGSPSSIFPDQIFLTKMSDVPNIASKDPKLAGNGTGPYEVASFTPDQTLSLVPNPNYWGPKPCFSRIDFIREPDFTSMVTAFTSGKLDMAFQVPTSAVSKIQSDKNASILKPTTISSVQAWEVDTTSPPFNNVAARQALSYAIDRATMVKVAFAGQAIPTLTNDLVNPTNPAFDKKLTPYTFDLDKAKQLFTQAGVQPGTTFTFLTDGTPEWTTMGEILQQDLQKIGLKLTIDQEDESTYLDKFYPPGKTYPGVIVANFLSLQPNPVLTLAFPTSGKCECNFNSTVYDGLLSKAFGSTNRQATLDQMQAMVSTQAPVFTIASQTNIVAVSNKVQGVWQDPRGNVHLEDAQLAP